MSRTLTPGMVSHLASRTTTLATMLRLDLKDGTSMGFTDHDNPLTFDLGDGELEYSPWTGVDVAAIALVTGLEASNTEVSGPISDQITRTAVMGGKFRGATARLFMVNWGNLSDGPIRILKGEIGQCRIAGARFVFEVRGIAGRFNETWGRVLSPLCTADFGNISTGCPVTRIEYPATVTAVTDDFKFRVSFSETHPDAYFDWGSVKFLTGDLADAVEISIAKFTGSTNEIELFEPAWKQPAVGDTLNVFRGCSKLLRAADANIPTCLTYGAVEDFRGFPEVPGARSYYRVSAPGQAYA